MWALLIIIIIIINKSNQNKIEKWSESHGRNGIKLNCLDIDDKVTKFYHTIRV